MAKNQVQIETWHINQRMKYMHPGIWILWICVMIKIIWKSKDPEIIFSLISKGSPHVDWLFCNPFF